ncbi:hypothetical protein [Salibaculum griseiflavum]|jgi:hypothetical protein|uniref:Uncharacterized protein n=1 Tax=Salibaculum griseiflavum TaxID=1914409 RepID=A0A2V1P0P7_9RHOB|nr:hypothetical protein [Salibaculum griseiflavum]PWG16025.1 hypothetical protein DFK10_14015 [Salibaculum griseiflavum]
MRLMTLVLLGGLTACSPFPQFDLPRDPAGAERSGGAYPTLAPLTGILARADALATSERSGPATLSGLAGRLAALEARAARLRGPVLDPSVRQRLLRGVARPTLQ